VDYLLRLLNSISKQEFRDFEVVVSDDSPDDSVLKLTDQFNKSFTILYKKNLQALGTPSNWNAAIRLANGEWIKLMHDDDWFYDPHSLGHFADAASASGSGFIFSAYENIFLNKNTSQTVFPQKFRLKLLAENPVTLFSRNCIGPPSVIMHKNDGKVLYDIKTKWVVDIDFYIQRLKFESFKYISTPLVKVGMSSEQVTVSCINDSQVLVSENFYLLEKCGWHHLRNFWIYDSFWRLIRNLELKNREEIVRNGFKGEYPFCLDAMMKFQTSIPSFFLNFGPVSKILMAFHFLNNRKGISI
jgi:glycosyltransferase involved in cell wall biosynthesis